MFIFIHKNHSNNTYGVYDTDDNTLDYITEQELVSLIRHNIRIDGVMRGKNGYCFRINKDMLVVYDTKHGNETTYNMFLNNQSGNYILGGFTISLGDAESEVSFKGFTTMSYGYKAEAYKVALKFLNEKLDGSVRLLVPCSDILLFYNYPLRSGFYTKPL